MIEGKMFYLIPVRNVRKSSGVLCNFMIRYRNSSGSVDNEIGKLIDEIRHRVDFEYNLKGLYNVSLMLDNVKEADEFKGNMSALRGVRDVRMNIIKDFIFVDDWLDDIIEKKLRA
jgi:uncharacterized protein (UPF0332 family)